MIIAVDELPVVETFADKIVRDRETISKDIREAIDKGITKFRIDMPLNAQLIAKWALAESANIYSYYRRKYVMDNINEDGSFTIITENEYGDRETSTIPESHIHNFLSKTFYSRIDKFIKISLINNEVYCELFMDEDNINDMLEYEWTLYKS